MRHSGMRQRLYSLRGNGWQGAGDALGAGQLRIHGRLLISGVGISGPVLTTHSSFLRPQFTVYSAMVKPPDRARQLGRLRMVSPAPDVSLAYDAEPQGIGLAWLVLYMRGAELVHCSGKYATRSDTGTNLQRMVVPGDAGTYWLAEAPEEERLT